jgi:hypothetical protein
MMMSKNNEGHIIRIRAIVGVGVRGGEIMISLEIVIINKMSLDQNFRLVVIYIAQRR